VVNFVIIKGWFLNGLLNFDRRVFLIGFINGIMGGEFIGIGGGFVGGGMAGFMVVYNVVNVLHNFHPKMALFKIVHNFNWVVMDLYITLYFVDWLRKIQHCDKKNRRPHELTIVEGHINTSKINR
jgi:hypothetical protein